MPRGTQIECLGAIVFAGLWAVGHFHRLTGAYVVVGAVGVFVGIEAKVIYLHLIETATIFFVLLPRDYTNI